ncbi:sigma-70 family RNA polymerase sigma factor [Halosquirtibacter xylanolyticus]|uniref:RNA polymerase sigma factor n=1 Tax=Halosquirtibacter xylanolyticus TaxID=3374599 RepID=UPI003748385A|nr:sigma-70 family RNA polymerase sigma factor [Prolixibacteraceae bacterium]
MELSAEKELNCDHIWVVKALAGSSVAYAELLQRHYGPVYQWVRSAVLSDQEAEDISIEAFTKAFLNLSSYNKEYAFSTWIFRIAKNHCIDYLRKRSLPLTFTDQAYLLEQGMHQSFSENSETPETILHKRDFTCAVHGMVACLSPQYSKLIELRYFHDYSYEEISKALNLSVDIIKVQLFRAKKRLRVLVDKDGGRNSLGFEI